jgi:hypothetical protein
MRSEFAFMPGILPNGPVLPPVLWRIACVARAAVKPSVPDDRFEANEPALCVLTRQQRRDSMLIKTLSLGAAAAVLALPLLASAPAEARPNCLKGAVVGGLVGHFAGGHGVAGAAGGCAVGHVMGNRDRDRNSYERSGYDRSDRRGYDNGYNRY